MATKFEIIIFTTTIKEYADQILNQLDPENKIFIKRFYREHTENIENQYNLKDLSIINKDIQKTIIIDNIPENFTKHKENGIYIKSWYNNTNDTALKELIPILLELANSQTTDVRTYLKYFKSKLIDDIQKGCLNPCIE